MSNVAPVGGEHPIRSLRISLLNLMLWLGVFGLQVVLSFAVADSGEWTWMSGSDTVNQGGIYGTQGIPHPDNVPGARYGSASWTDADGRLWLIGGMGWDSAGNRGRLNDLWRYDSIGGWIWISGSDTVNQTGIYGTQGTPHPDNVPGARDGSSRWWDSDGNLWLMGGYGYDSVGEIGFLNDLWRYDSNHEWTWMGGPNVIDQAGVYGVQGVPDADNVPGARRGSAQWIDDDESLWLMGGVGKDGAGTQGRLNDLWRYDSNGNWTWVSGSDIVNQPGVYGTQSIPHPDNVPGARYGGVSWIDEEGNLWLMGGAQTDSLTLLNDLWRFDGNGEWTWMSGSHLTNRPGIYGGQGSPNPNNVPGSRTGSVSWIDTAGNLWLMGGHGRDGVANLGNLNDLWRYDGNGEWTWMSGSSTAHQNGVYGTQGTPHPANVPGSRFRSVSWIDATGNLWLMGGYGRDRFGDLYDYLNDLWRYGSLAAYTVMTEAINGSITSIPDPVVSQGDTTTVTGLADANHYFSDVSGCDGTPQNNTDQSISEFVYETGAITEDCTVTAEFTIRTYTVTTAAINGTITSAVDPVIDHGGTTIVTGTADVNHYFSGVSGCGGISQSNADQSISEFSYQTGTIDEECTVTAEFAVRTYTATTKAVNGTITSAIDPAVDHGDFVSVTGEAEVNHYFIAVSGCGGIPQDNVDQSVTEFIYDTGPIVEDCAVIAEFAVKTYTVTPSAGAGGGIHPNSPQSVGHGQVIAFQVTPDSGYDFDEVGGNCGGALSGDIYTINPVTGNCTVDAGFRPDTVTEVFSGASPAFIDEAVFYTVEVAGTDSAPSDGQVLVEASTGEVCKASDPSSTLGNQATFSCQITYSSPGNRTVTAVFGDSSTHGKSASPAITQHVVGSEEVFLDRFEGGVP